MTIIFPPDVSTKFLCPIVDAIAENLEVSIEQPNFILESKNEFYERITNTSIGKTILFLGHGTAEELKINANEGITSIDSLLLFKNKKIILFSCFSSEFLFSNNHFEAAIGFGNILTSVAELSPSDYQKYNYEEFKCIGLFSQRLVAIFKSAIILSYERNYTFIQTYNILRLKINKVICDCALSKNNTERLVGELMFDLKNEMIIIGNSKAMING